MSRFRWGFQGAEYRSILLHTEFPTIPPRRPRVGRLSDFLTQEQEREVPLWEVPLQNDDIAAQCRRMLAGPAAAELDGFGKITSCCNQNVLSFFLLLCPCTTQHITLHWHPRLL